MDTISEKKQALIDKFHTELPEVGEKVYLKNKYFSGYNRDKTESDPESFSFFKGIVISFVNKETGEIEGREEKYYELQKAPIGDYKRNPYDVGIDPFYQGAQIRDSGYDLESILHQLDLIDISSKDKYFLKETNGEG